MDLVTIPDIPIFQPSRPVRRSMPVPESRLSLLTATNLVARQATSSTSSSESATTSCGPKDTTGPCERSVLGSTNTTLPIVLGVVIPLSAAFAVLIYLHRRNKKKLRREDAEDRDKSLDFGMGGVHGTEKAGKRGRKGRAVPEMSKMDAQNTVRGDRGISMDMTMSNPYLLPPELHQSRESLHSLSRSYSTGDDKYRATNFIPDDGSLRSPSSLKSHWDDSSTYTGSSRPRMDSESTRNLIPTPPKTSEVVPQIRKPAPVAKDEKSALAIAGTQEPPREPHVSMNNNGNGTVIRTSNKHLGAQIGDGQKPDKSSPEAAELDSRPPIAELASVAFKDGREKRKSAIPENIGFNFGLPGNVHELPSHESPQGYTPEPPRTYSPEPSDTQSGAIPQVNVVEIDDQHGDSSKSLSLSPPPKIQPKRVSSVYDDNYATFANHPNAYAWPHDMEKPGHLSGQHEYTDPHRRMPSESQEQHRDPAVPEIQVNTQEYDYYDDDNDEYDGYDINQYKDALGYDPRLLTMGMRPLPPDDPSENPEQRANRIRSFYKEYFDEAAKPGGGNRLSYFDATDSYLDDYYGTSESSPYGSRPATQQNRHRAMSNGSYGPRAFSSASGRYGRQPMRSRPRKKLPPPKDLNILPTPHMLKDDSMLPNPIDYAPPQMFKNQRAGTPESLRGGLRPYTPSTRAYNPLVSSFDDLAVLPSPHQMRKSGLYTSLDFAPPRFQAKADSNMSDAGSIRSNRSGISALHQHNIRNGAYRVSRIPREVAGTKDELSQALRPQWSMNR